jgi:hypothetical protein
MEIATPPTIIFRVAALCVSRCQSAFKFGSAYCLTRDDAVRVTFADEAIGPVNFGRRSPGSGGQYCRPNDTRLTT